MEIVKRNCCVAMPLDPDNRLLLQKKNADYVYWPNYWCTFGGGMKDSEDPKTTLLREMREENGLEFFDVELFESQIFYDESQIGPKKRREGLVHYFSARFDGDLKKIKFGEGSGFSIFDKPELYKYNKLGLIVPYNYEVIERFMNSL